MASKDPNYVSLLDENRTVWLQTIVRQGRRRLFLQRLWKVVGLAAAASLCIAAVGFALWRLGITLPKYMLALLLLPWTVALIFAVPWRIPDIEIARRIDHANQLGDRLSSAIAFLNKNERSEWIDKQIDDAVKRIENETERTRLLKQTFERQPFAFRSLSIVLLIGSAVLFILPSVVHNIRAKHVPIVEKSIEGEKQKPNLDAAAHTLRQAQVEKMIESAEEIQDDALKNAAEELRQILKEDQDGKLSPEEFQKRLDALQNKLAQLDKNHSIPSADEQRAIDQTVKEAIQTLTQMKEDPETEALADALEQNDYDKAADILRDLLKSTDPEDKKKLEKLSKMFGDLAKNLDPTDPKLKEALQKNKDLVQQLQKEFDHEKLSDEDRKNFMDAAKKLRNEQKQSEQQQKSNQNNENNASKTIDALQKAFEKQSKQLDQTSKSQSTADQAKPGDEQNADAEQPKPSGEPNDSAEQPKTSGEPNDSAEQSKPGGEPNDSAEQPKSSGEPNDSAEQSKPGGESSSPAEEALRDMASQKAAQQQRDELQKIADKMKQDAEHNQNQNEDDGDDAERNRQKNMQDFLERAQGKQPDKDSESSKEKNDPNQDQAQQGAQDQQDGSQQGQQDGSQQGQQDGSQQGAQDGSQQGAQDGSQQGAQQGAETLSPQGSQNGDHDTSEGAPTSMDVQYKDETLTGMDSGEAESTGDVIESAGQKGFASESYKKVYQTYEKSAESVLESDDVPQGYKNYIRRYFDMIQPQ